MVEQERLLTLIKSYLPDASEVESRQIAQEVKKDLECLIDLMVSEAVLQARQNAALK
ncbi:MAG TPA: hypothetical protein PKA10_18820 [Selenomonadales bacterium]|nr:hypothetical protein [Selenomonadales bacterium]